MGRIHVAHDAHVRADAVRVSSPAREWLARRVAPKPQLNVL